MIVEIWSDIACPWCYVGKRRFERALAAFPAAEEVEVVFRPYQLDPGTPTTPEPLLDPPGVRASDGSHGLCGVPRCWLVPKPP